MGGGEGADAAGDGSSGPPSPGGSSVAGPLPTEEIGARMPTASKVVRSVGGLTLLAVELGHSRRCRSRTPNSPDLPTR